MADETDGLSFERAEPSNAAPAGPVCENCGQLVTTAYYAINGHVTCDRCRGLIEQLLTAGRGAGSMLRALLYGCAAAVLGTIIYYAVLAISNIEFGLLAILVGWMVGKAVRRGSGSLGGLKYQLLAVLLTYLSIVCSYAPLVLKAVNEQPPAGGNATSQAERKAEWDNLSTGRYAGRMAAAAVALVALSAAMPFLSAAHNPLGLLIIFFGLYQAWMLNRRPKLTISGPHYLSQPPPEPLSDAV